MNYFNSRLFCICFRYSFILIVFLLHNFNPFFCCRQKMMIYCLWKCKERADKAGKNKNSQEFRLTNFYIITFYLASKCFYEENLFIFWKHFLSSWKNIGFLKLYFLRFFFNSEANVESPERTFVQPDNDFFYSICFLFFAKKWRRFSFLLSKPLSPVFLT